MVQTTPLKLLKLRDRLAYEATTVDVYKRLIVDSHGNIIGYTSFAGHVQEYEHLITAEQVRGKAKHIYYGWWIVFGAFGIQLLLAGLLMQAFSSYAAVLQQEFGWSRTALSGAFSMQRVESGLLGPAQGWLLVRFGSRNVMRVGITLFGLGFIGFSQINSLWTFYLVFLVMAVGASLGGFMSLTTTLVNWFVKRRTTAMGIAQTGMSIGGLVVPIVAWSLVSNGWRTTAFVSGFIVLLVGLPLTQLMRSRPEDYGLLPDGEDTRNATIREDGVLRSSSSDEVEFTSRQAMRTRSFWFISLGHGTAVLVVSAVMVHLVLDLNEELGYSIQAASLVIALMTIMQMLGLLFGGYVGDRFEKRWLAAGAMVAQSLALLSLAYAQGVGMVVFFAVVNGIAWGMRGPLMQAMRADYFGRKSFAQIMGFSSMIVMIGMTSGPLIAGILADKTGSYTLGFTILAIMVGLGSLFFVFAKKPDPPASKAITSPVPASKHMSVAS